MNVMIDINNKGSDLNDTFYRYGEIYNVQKMIYFPNLFYLILALEKLIIKIPHFFQFILEVFNFLQLL